MLEMRGVKEGPVRLTAQQSSTVLPVSSSSVYRYIRRGILKATWVRQGFGGLYLVDPADLVEFADKYGLEIDRERLAELEDAARSQA